MAIVRVSFVLDTAALGIEEEVEREIVIQLLASARANHIARQAATRADASLSNEEKGQEIAIAVRGMALALMAEANLVVEPMPATTPVETSMPVGRSFVQMTAPS